MQFIGVAGRDDVGEMNDFVARHGLGDFPHIRDEDGEIWQQYGIFDQPAWIFVDDDGTGEVVIATLGEDGLRQQAEALTAP